MTLRTLENAVALCRVRGGIRNGIGPMAFTEWHWLVHGTVQSTRLYRGKPGHCASTAARASAQRDDGPQRVI